MQSDWEKSLDLAVRQSRRQCLKIGAASVIALAAGVRAKANGSSLNNEESVTTGVPAGFASRTVQLEDVTLHYTIGGSGPPVLLVHGWPETWFEWRHMMPLLARQYTVIAPDLRGMGDSSLEPGGYDKKTLAQDLFHLTQYLGLPRISVVGHDWGAPVAYALAAQYRDLVDRLVLVEGVPFGPWLADTNVLWFFSLLRIPGYAEQLITGRERAFLKYFYDNRDMHVVPGSFDDASIGVYLRSFARPGRMQPSYELYRSIDQDVRDNAVFARRPLSIPVLAVAADHGAGPAAFVTIQHVASNITTMLFKDTGHFIPEERPLELSAAVLRFLNGQSVSAQWQPARRAPDLLNRQP